MEKQESVFTKNHKLFCFCQTPHPPLRVTLLPFGARDKVYNYLCYYYNMKRHNYSKKSLIRAKDLRQNMTDFEQKLWFYLRGRRFQNLKICRQVPVGNYIVDFLCKEKRVIVELDGSGHVEEKQKIMIQQEMSTSKV